MSGARRLGLFFVLCVALIWVAASFLVQSLEEAGLPALLLTYISNSLFVVLLPVAALARRRQQRLYHSLSDDVKMEESEFQQAAPISTWRTWLSLVYDANVMKAAAVVAPLWFLAQLTFNASLSRTTVSSNTILASTASLVTYALACLVLGEAYVPSKLLSIIVCMIGTAMVTLGDSQNSTGRSSLVGDLLVLLSSLFYACYTIAIRRMLPDEGGHANVSLLFGTVGALNAVCLAPVLALLLAVSAVDVSRVTGHMLGLNVLKGLFDNVLSDYLWARAVLLIGPTVATVGLSVQVPLAVVADMTLQRPAWLKHPGQAVLISGGAVAVIAGFLGVNLSREPASGPAAHQAQDQGALQEPEAVAQPSEPP